MEYVKFRGMQRNEDIGLFALPSVFEASLACEHHGRPGFVAGLDGLVIIQ
jgi:hypothetical protein